MREVKLHVETLDRFIGETMAMAERLDRGECERQAAHIAFESMETFLKVLTPNRWALLRALRGRGPSSIRALAQTLGRDYRGVHADVATLVDAGLDRARRRRRDFGALVSGHRGDGAGRGRFRGLTPRGH